LANRVFFDNEHQIMNQELPLIPIFHFLIFLLPYFLFLISSFFFINQFLVFSIVLARCSLSTQLWWCKRSSEARLNRNCNLPN